MDILSTLSSKLSRIANMIEDVAEFQSTQLSGAFDQHGGTVSDWYLDEETNLIADLYFARGLQRAADILANADPFDAAADLLEQVEKSWTSEAAMLAYQRHQAENASDYQTTETL